MVFIQYASLMLLAFAVSLDSFSAGMAYGLRNMRIPFFSIVVIAICSFMTIFVATGVANGLFIYFPMQMAERLGGVILIVLGVWGLYQVVQDHGRASSEENSTPVHKTVYKMELKKLGIVIQVLKSPMKADMDQSGVISGWEAVLLGVALSLDAFGAGIGASLMGYAPWLTAVSIGLMSSLFLYLGMRSAGSLTRVSWINRLVYLPAFVLISIGVWKLF
jgi:putative sporulation protein YtaF